MYITLDFESSIPIYEQIKNQIIIGIAKNNLQNGDRLPAVRALASDLGINLHTVNKAYQQLKQEGFVQIHRQRGVIIQVTLDEIQKETYKQEIYHILLPLIAETSCKDISKNDIFDMLNNIYDELGR